MGFIFLFAIVLSLFTNSVFKVDIFQGSTRVSSLKEIIFPALISSFPKVFLSLLFLIGGRYLFLMGMANIPMYTVPMMFYSYVLFNALIF